ncbi:MAG TPA: YkgJ family cysteine cluster protein, partial [Polyangia bacterium]|nr:YkgJ family cysteine cluster protein [Polyangia bacterium]
MLVRPGARFTCHADGLCCSDIHVLGPIEEAELVPLRALGHRIVGRDASVDGWAFRVGETGACPFLESHNLCRVHATRGPQVKPATCRLFPFYLVGTPAGVRVSTSHRDVKTLPATCGSKPPPPPAMSSRRGSVLD